jgi:hypothetical protein
MTQYKVSSIKDALVRARRELDAHREVCTAWDYESSDCVSCAVCERRYAYLRNAFAKAGL